MKQNKFHYKTARLLHLCFFPPARSGPTLNKFVYNKAICIFTKKARKIIMSRKAINYLMHAKHALSHCLLIMSLANHIRLVVFAGSRGVRVQSRLSRLRQAQPTGQHVG